MSVLAEGFGIEAADAPPRGGRAVAAPAGGGLGGGLLDPAEEIDAPTRVETALSIIAFIGRRLGPMKRIVIERGDATRTPVRSDMRWEWLTGRPNRDDHSAPWWIRLWMQLEGWSEAFVYRRRVGGVTVGLDLLHPSRVVVMVSETGRREYAYRHPRGGRTVYSAEEVVHLMAVSWDGLRGTPPMQWAAAAHRISASQDRWQTVHYRRSARPAGVVSTPGRARDAAAVANFYAGWEEQIADPAGPGVLLLQSGAQYSPVIPADDAHLLSARQYTREQILGAYAPGIPHHILGWRSNTSNWGTGIEQQGLHMLTHVFELRFELVSDVLSAEFLPAELQLWWDTGGWIRQDAKTTADVAERMRRSGQATRDECRRMAGLGPLSASGLPDDLWRPTSMDAVQVR